MLYYKALAGDIYDFKSGYTTVKDELVTAKEREKMFPTIPDKFFKTVSISKFNTVMWFGCRFEG